MKRSTRSPALILFTLMLCAALAGCDLPAAEIDPPTDAAASLDAARAPTADPELEAARLLLRYEKARIDGVMPPASWPEPGAVRFCGTGTRGAGGGRFRTWIVDVDTSDLPGGYPEQFVVEVYGAGGHGEPAKR